MSKKEQDEEKTITPAGEVELTEDELDQVNGGYTSSDGCTKKSGSRVAMDIDDIKPRSPGTIKRN